MPSPFPGMDPYLEGDDWTSFHAHLATEIARHLAPKLRPKYVALPQRRFGVVDDDAVSIEAIYPDVGVLAAHLDVAQTIGRQLTTVPCILETFIEEKVPHSWIEIRDAAGRSLVTRIEILSTWNKRGRGRTEYLKKRRELLRSSAHLVEIDLLLRGKRLPMKSPLPAAAYYVFVARADERPKVRVWPAALDHPLPAFGVPLLPGDPAVCLELQTCFQNVYDAGGFDLIVDYSTAPAVALSVEQSAWVAERLRATR